MEHPFINRDELNNLKIEELQEKISSIHNKLTFAYRTHNTPLINQLNMVLESYRAIYTAKMNEVFDKQNLSGKINIQQDKKTS